MNNHTASVTWTTILCKHALPQWLSIEAAVVQLYPRDWHLAIVAAAKTMVKTDNKQFASGGR